MAEKGRSAEMDAYIAAFPEDVQKILQNLRELVHQESPEAEEAMAYGIPTFRLGGNLVHFAGYKKHIGFYPAPSAIEYFREALTGYKQARGSVQFPLGQPIPYDLVRRMVVFRIAENKAKLDKKRKN